MVTEPARLKTLFLVPSLRRAGAQTQVVDLVNGLDSRRFEKHLFTFHTVLELLERIDREQVVFYNHPRSHKFDLGPVQEIARLIDHQGIDVIHCSLQFSLLLAWLARRMSRRKPPLVAAIHTTVNRSLKEALQDRLIYRHLLKRSAGVIFVCENQRNHWLKKHPALKRNSRVIYNGIDVARFDPDAWGSAGQRLRAALDIPGGAQVIACVAGFRPEKGHGQLIDAFAGLSGTPYLVFAGEGETRSAMELRIRESGLADRVRFLGVVEDVRPLLAMASISVLASTAVETFSIAMLESMAMGVPMVATNIGGMGEAILPGDTGFLVPPGDVEALRMAIADALSDTRRLHDMGRAARALVQARFTLEAMVEQTSEVLQAAAG